MLKEFWRDNKIGYYVTCASFAIAGYVVYAMTTPDYKLQNYLAMLPFFWVGIYVMALGMYAFIYGGNN